MSAPALASPLFEHSVGARRFVAAPTLDAAISALWARTSAGRAVACPLCQGEMQPQYGSGARPVAGRCRDCGTVLS
jgi:hypothetical protein